MRCAALRLVPSNVLSSILALSCCLALAGCHEDTVSAGADAGPPPVERPAAYTVALLMKTGVGGDLDELEFTVAKINAAGGIHGEVPLRLRYVDTEGLSVDEVAAEAQALIDDASVSLVIGPETPLQMMAVAPLFIDGHKPLIAYKPTSSDILRAFQGSPFIWRTKPSDIFQIEWIVREARRENVQTIGLVTSVEKGAQSAFDWFGFTATAAGYTAEQIFIETWGANRTCTEAAEAMIARQPEELVIAATERADLACIVAALHAARLESGAYPFEIVLPDLGPNMTGDLSRLGEDAHELEGWVSTHHPDTGLDGEFEGHVGPDAMRGLPSDGAAGHDAILLAAHALELSDGVGGMALAMALQALTSGDGTTHGPHADGVQSSLEAIRAGEAVDLVGAAGALQFDPDAGMDLVSATLGKWRYAPDQEPKFQILEYVDIGGADGPPGPTLLGTPGADSFVDPVFGGPDAFAPATPEPTRTKALIIAASAGWENYRHQSDALERYQRLKAAGLTDEDIVMVGADDIVDHPENAQPGIIRNTPGGPDVYAGVQYDYGIELTPQQIGPILLGQASPETPAVLDLDAETNLYVYLVGHGGLVGLVLGATSVEEGLAGGAGLAIYEPDMLREALCALRAENRVRRVFVEVESCHAGVFGDPLFLGIEAGCGDGGEPLKGVVMMTAANTRENSLGAGYDLELKAWVTNEFSQRVVERLDNGPEPSLYDLHRDVYLKVRGSHTQMYNANAFGDVSTINPISEFYGPPLAPPAD